jgi:hypothetical protein
MEKSLTNAKKIGTEMRKNRRESRNAEREDRIIFPFFDHSILLQLPLYIGMNRKQEKGLVPSRLQIYRNGAY